MCLSKRRQPSDAANNRVLIPASYTTPRHYTPLLLNTAVPQALPTAFGRRSTTALPHRQPAPTATSRDSCGAEGHDKGDTL